MKEPRCLTMNANLDDMTDEEYRALYDAVSAGKKDREFARLVGTPPGHATWSGYRRGNLRLSRVMKQKLRAEGDRQELPPTIGEIVESRVDPNAAVYELGMLENGGLAERVLIIFGEEEMRVDGQALVVQENALQPRLQARNRGYKSIALSMGVYGRAIAFKAQHQLTWDGLVLLAMRGEVE